MLHTVNKSPFENGALESCLRLARKGSPILLIEDGIYGAIRGTAVSPRVAQAMKDHPVFALGPDVKARGMEESRLLDGVKVVDYGDFVDLVVEHGTVQAWL